jgi:hypothetical protein
MSSTGALQSRGQNCLFDERLPLTQLLQQPPLDCFNTRQLAFPNHYDAPTQLKQHFPNFCIAPFVRLEFLLPERMVAFWLIRELASFVPMPEAAVDKDHSLSRRQDNIRSAWK